MASTKDFFLAMMARRLAISNALHANSFCWLQHSPVYILAMDLLLVIDDLLSSRFGLYRNS